MLDPSTFQAAVELVDQTQTMPVSEASRHIHDRYRIASPEMRDAIVLALTGALSTARQRVGINAGMGPSNIPTLTPSTAGATS